MWAKSGSILFTVAPAPGTMPDTIEGLSEFLWIPHRAWASEDLSSSFGFPLAGVWGKPPHLFGGR